VNEDRLRIWAARLAAPVAFFVAAFVLVALVQRALSAGDETPYSTPTTTAPTPTDTTAEPTTTGRTEPSPGRRRYRVREGDTLDSIAERFDTTVEALIDLNPGIEPLNLDPGERIRVRA
jgi:LysM repeat protein